MRKTKKEVICPKCGSDNAVQDKQTGYIVMLSILLLGIPLPILKKSFYCFDCEHKWK